MSDTSKTKTIKIEPKFFENLGKSKTKTEKKRPLPKPIIVNPNSLKKHFLNRIKQHKQQEKQLQNVVAVPPSNNDDDEFYKSIDYLDSVMKQHKEDSNEKMRREQLAKKTVKNRVTDAPVSPYIHVELDLPDALKPDQLTQMIQVHGGQAQAAQAQAAIQAQSVQVPDKVELSQVVEAIKLNYAVDNKVPYGCLKNGIKETYRDWQKNNITQKQIPSINDRVGSISERERKMQALKTKIKMQQQENTMLTQNLISNVEQAVPLANPLIGPSLGPSLAPSLTVHLADPTKKMLKKTIRRKYTLGKSKIYRSVGILIKDARTRKKIISAHKELKKKPINEVKQYLRDHGFMKAGSNAPNNVIRKMYESAMLTGDVTNDNRDTILHNFMNDVPE